MASHSFATPSSSNAVRSTWPLLQRLWSAMIAAQRARADRCVANYLQNIGWKLTDAAEREIERRSPPMQ